MVWRVGNANFAKVIRVGGGHGVEPVDSNKVLYNNQ
jgi:hypothetical protein